MAGTDAGFDSAAFRDGIHFAMRMGAAPDEAQQVFFHFATPRPAGASADGRGVPFNPAASPASGNTPTPVQVDCAVEYFDIDNQPTAFGLMAPSHIAITLLDQEYELVKDSTYIVVHGDRYNRRREEPPVGLFDVGVHVIHYKAENET